MRILVLEPDEYYHPHFMQNLSPVAELLIEPTAERAEAVFEKERPDAVVMDLLLPDRSGYEFLEKIQKKFTEQPVPIIIFSRITHIDDIKASLGFGITGYFVKGQDSVNDIKKLILNLNN